MNMISYLECYNYCDILLWWIRSKLISLTSLYIIWSHVTSFHVIKHKNHKMVLQTIDCCTVTAASLKVKLPVISHDKYITKAKMTLRESFLSGFINIRFTPKLTQNVPFLKCNVFKAMKAIQFISDINFNRKIIINLIKIELKSRGLRAWKPKPGQK